MLINGGERKMKEYMTLKEIADYYKVHENTIRNWIEDGMPHIKIGRVIRFDIKDVEVWIAGKTTKD